jgi:choline dehydrogenase-like flavoprotein
MIRRGRELAGAVREDADAVVVGTGAGGGMAIRELARAGLRVVALEEGGWHRPSDFTQREDEMIPLLFQERGARMTHDRAIRVLQGRGIGGSTLHNTNLCKRTPPEILDLWARRHGVSGCGVADLAPVFDEVERDLSVSEIPEDRRNANNQALARGVAALGLRGGPLRHNRVGCQGSGFCELGCIYDAKQNAAKVLIPAALDTGNATVWADVRALRVEHERGAVTGVSAMAIDAEGRQVASVTVRARIVVLAASAVGSASLALASGLPDASGRTGRGLRMHPGAAVAGLFDDRIDGWKGIPQSYECTEWLDFAEGSDKRVWVTTVFAHPIGAAVAMTGFGAAHMATMRRYAHMASLVAMVHDETDGQVELDGDGRPVLRYVPSPGDRAQLVLGLRGAARILLAAGAREVVVPAIPSLRITSEKGLDAIGLDVVRPHGVPLTAVHPMGTMRMGDDPKAAVVASTGEHHGVHGLFVLDGSLFPTSLGAPPQISIYTFARHLAKHAVARARG